MEKKLNNAVVSLIIAVYNADKYLQRCLDSVVKQTYTNLEIILVDDGSTDTSRKICDTYAALDKRIQVLHQPNRGVCVARNYALAVATGEYLCFADADDKLTADYVTTMVANIASHDMVMCGYYFVNEKGKILEKHLPYNCTMPAAAFMHTYLDDEINNFHNRNDRPIIGGYLWNKLFRRRIWGDIRFLPNRYVADTLVVTSYVGRSNSICCITACKYFYYEVAGSITNQKKLDIHIDDQLVIRKEQRDLIGLFLQQRGIADYGLLTKSCLLVLMAYISIFTRYLHAGQENSHSCQDYLQEYKRELATNFACLRHCKRLLIHVVLILCYFMPVVYFKVWHLNRSLSR